MIWACRASDLCSEAFDKTGEGLFGRGLFRATAFLHDTTPSAAMKPFGDGMQLSTMLST